MSFLIYDCPFSPFLPPCLISLKIKIDTKINMGCISRYGFFNIRVSLFHLNSLWDLWQKMYNAKGVLCSTLYFLWATNSIETSISITNSSILSQTYVFKVYFSRNSFNKVYLRTKITILKLTHLFCWINPLIPAKKFGKSAGSLTKTWLILHHD